MSHGLSATAVNFLRVHAGTPVALDVLLTIVSDASRWWTGKDVARCVGIPSERIIGILDGLAVANLLDIRVGSDVLYRFAPLDDVNGEIDEIDRLRRLDPTAVDRLFQEGV